MKDTTKVLLIRGALWVGLVTAVVAAGVNVIVPDTLNAPAIGLLAAVCVGGLVLSFLAEGD